MKRGFGSSENDPPAKRPRLNAIDRFSALSDELILRTFAYLSIRELVLCHRYEALNLVTAVIEFKDKGYRVA